MDKQAAVIRARSARLRRFVSGAETVLWLLLLLERFGPIALQIVEHGVGGTVPRALATQMIAAIPEAIYLLALEAIRRALKDIEEGKFYAPAITRMLDRMGLMLAGGAFIGIFVVPTLERAFGVSPGYWIAFDISGFVLGVLGLTLTVIARVIGHAATMQAELDEIF